ncbi:MAG: phosphoribosylglycinamide formyltransferase [Candidatus Lambdaproteobacteria bacterium RIFOXYD12_FULL_49_8]|uniref:Phosphoribosylglycinamide formyltransferase n=1 Tax=Candidatus Lambdaproteobacteria bacterium RIFOXYD2_FULL_50_16 TaxID=1817772 RepID=A0A1F6G5Q3_9PROT|nr:MAG: phosphoribosylglycinamide formyltransferase [Candidatus Lambdaproteobacteria bacterium RIFOXYD2_FULL_50_16]OGG97973.1 MAG: phosphoribosylglycinamide formyltransferase [Candidatus Lambdaproteobacteria bacterium RIFOXYD12_FULL_49_8]
MKVPTAVIISGAGSNLQAIIDYWKACDPAYDLKLVISNQAQAKGLVRAVKAGLPVMVIDHKKFATREAFDADLHQSLKDQGIELIALAGFLRLLSDKFVKDWAGKMINIHPSLLPAFPGLKTHQKALKYGVRYSGCSVIFVDEGVDSGAIIEQAVVPVLDGDTEMDLALRVLKEEHRIFPLALDEVAHGRVKLVDGLVVRTPQDDQEGVKKL